MKTISRNKFSALLVIALAASQFPAEEAHAFGRLRKKKSPKTAVTGFLDAVDSDGHAAGWAADSKSPSTQLEIRYFVDTTSTNGQAAGSTTANQARADLPVSGDHGYGFTVDSKYLDGAEHQLYAYAMSGSSYIQLGGSPKPFTGRPANVAHTEAEYSVTLMADNGKYVTADLGANFGKLSASRDSALDRETFYILPREDGTVTIRNVNGLYLTAEGNGGGELTVRGTEVGPWQLFRIEGDLSDGGKIALKTNDGLHYVTARLDMDPPVLMATAEYLQGWEQFKVGVSYAPVKARKGIVRAQHRTFVDDDGAFSPLGQTLFWALRGWKFERDRLKQNLQFLKKHKYDYIRILGEVDWAGNDIDPNWPDYAENLAGLMDYAYNQCGLRIEMTILGGGHENQAMELTQKIASVVAAGRQHMVMNFEVANESYQRRISLEEMRRVGRYLRQTFPQNLVAISSGEGLRAYKASEGDWKEEFKDVYMQPDSANLATIHMDRGQGDDGWREVRQPYDWKDLDFPVSHNEPIGPRSSVAQEDDPVRLAMLRANGLINGVHAFVLHNASGVSGLVVPERQRPANIFEVPNIDAIMIAIKNVDKFIPPTASEGRHWNSGWSGNPWNTTKFWPGDSYGVNRNYTASTPDGWISVDFGIKDHADFTPLYRSRVEVIDVLLGKVAEVDLEAGQTYTLRPLSTDNHGYGAYIIIGHYR